MTLSSEQEQIKQSYELLKMTPEQIAEDRELLVTAVKAALMQCSSKYRQDCGALVTDKSEEEGDGCNFTSEEKKRVKDEIYNLAMSSDNESVKLKALTYIRDDSKGRLDIAAGLKSTIFNVLQFNENMLRADEIMAAAKPQKVNDLKSANSL